MSYSIFVGGLDSTITSEVLYSFFSTFGEIKQIEKESKNDYGFIEYEEEEDCTHAIENMNNSIINEKIIHVSIAKENIKQRNLKISVWKDEENKGGNSITNE